MGKDDEFIVQTPADKSVVYGTTLKSGIKLILISDDTLKTSSCTVSVNVGYLNDTHAGIAHFLEHLLFMGSEKYLEQNIYSSYIQSSNGTYNAFTGNNVTCYYLELDSKFLEKGIDMLSWFFRKPLFKEEHIKSEMEIVNSEHKKNILSDHWIIEDLFTNFMVDDGYYNKFGTGNTETLKDVTQKDILHFYNTYYTTDNMYVCIVDSQNIEYMKSNYIQYFEAISPSPNHQETHKDTLLKELIMTKDNLIIFKSISDEIYLNYYIVFKCTESNSTDYQLIKFIKYLLSSKYEFSYHYWMEEENIIKYVNIWISDFYDVNASIIVKNVLMLKETSLENFKIINTCLTKYIEILQTMSKDDFKIIYENYKNLLMLALAYEERSDAINIGQTVTNNLMRGKQFSSALIREYIIDDYDDNIYKNYIEMINNIDIKIITNIDIDDIMRKNVKNVRSTKHYNTKFIKTEYDMKSLDKSLNFELKYELLNIVLFKNNEFFLKPSTINNDKNTNKGKNKGKNKNKNILKLLKKTENQEIYLFDRHSHWRPNINISVIRKNINFLINENGIIVDIYLSICSRILTYFLHSMDYYMMDFSHHVENGYLIMDFHGLDYMMEYFVNFIVKSISIYSPLFEENFKKYYERIILQTIQHYSNIKYNSPYELCTLFFSVIQYNTFSPEQTIEFLNKLTFNTFIKKVKNLMCFEKEYIIFGGCFNSNIIDKHDKELFVDNTFSNIKNYIDILSLNKLQYVNHINAIQPDNKNKLDYSLKIEERNPNEINNAIMDNYLTTNYKMAFENDILKDGEFEKLNELYFINEFMANIFSEPLFDKIRTIDKLGYIVKCFVKKTVYNKNVNIFISYVVQSEYPIDVIIKSLDEFNVEFHRKFNKHKKKFEKQFEMLKKSKLLYYDKPQTHLTDEAENFVQCITKKYNKFNYVSIYKKIINNIKFKKIAKAINNFFTDVVKNNRYKIILNSE